MAFRSKINTCLVVPATGNRAVDAGMGHTTPQKQKQKRKARQKGTTPFVLAKSKRNEKKAPGICLG